MKTNCKPVPVLLSLAAASLLTGCAGYNSVFMATKTNVGLDIDTKTPTAEISIARREVVVAPTFENGQTPPMEASFRVKSGWIFADVATTFTGGDAAATVSDLFNRDTPIGAARTNIDTTIHLSTAPIRNHRGRAVHLQEPGTVRPLVFGTDTSLGIKVAWSGLTAQYPDSAKFGYNRKEMAYAPVFGATNTTTHKYDVKMPSFLATTDTEGKTSNPDKSTFRYQQYFATGKAADLLALEQGVRVALAERLDRAAASFKARDKEIQAEEYLAKECKDAIGKISEPEKLKRVVTRFETRKLLSKTNAVACRAKADTDVSGVISVLQEGCDHARTEDLSALKEFLSHL
jgi:hypothetical protein